jgi:hypothetical protein
LGLLPEKARSFSGSSKESEIPRSVKYCLKDGK